MKTFEMQGFRLGLAEVPQGMQLPFHCQWQARQQEQKQREAKHIQSGRLNFTNFTAFSSKLVWHETCTESACKVGRDLLYSYAPALAMGVPLGVLLWDDTPLPTDAVFL